MTFWFVIYIFSIACETFPTVYIDAGDEHRLLRSGHGTVMRNDSLYITGGTNGILLSDMFVVNITSFNVSSSANRSTCAG